jgi:hypothetical protein
MNSEKNKQCKSKDCNNPVLEGKYCNLCKQKRKETRENILKGTGAAASTAAILVVSIVKSKDTLKQVPKIVENVAKVILKK